MRHFILFFAILFLQPHYSSGQLEQLEAYIAQGLQNNADIKEAVLKFEASLENVNQMRGQQLPTLDLGSRYTRAFGGRAEEFPIGDLMNPVYNTLNGVVGENRFQEIDNLSLNFNRTTDIDTKLSLTQPVFDKRLSYQKKIAQEQARISNVDIVILKRNLVAKIKMAYFNYLKAQKLEELLINTKTLVDENLRVSEVLFKNDKVTSDATYRAKTEISRVELQTAEAEKMKNNARAYFNFLLNKPLETSIVAEAVPGIPQLPKSPAGISQSREEFSKINLGLEANKYQRKLLESNNLPNVYAVADYGFQGTEYTFSDDSDYALASLVLSWNLFSGFQNKAGKQKAFIEKQILETQRQELANSIELESIQAYYDAKEKLKSFESTEKMTAEAQFTYDLVNKKYAAGMANQVELIDARTTLTNASIQNIIAKYDIWISLAEFERVTATYPVNSL